MAKIPRSKARKGGKCYECGRTMRPDEVGDELPEERVCDQCASIGKRKSLPMLHVVWYVDGTDEFRNLKQSIGTVPEIILDMLHTYGNHTGIEYTDIVRGLASNQVLVEKGSVRSVAKKIADHNDYAEDRYNEDDFETLVKMPIFRKTLKDLGMLNAVEGKEEE